MIEDTLNWLYTAKPQWRGREIKDITPEDIDLFKTLLEEEVQETLDGVFAEDKTEVLDGVVDMMWICLNLAAMAGINPEELTKYSTLVSNSNWSKFDSTEDDASKSVDLYASGMHPDKMGQKIETTYRRMGENTFVIERVSDGKILKSYKYNKLT